MLDLATNAVAFVFPIGLIIFVHEGGHFLGAKAFGMRVLAFSLGFGKRVWGFRRGETEYQLAALPLGGYVKLSGEEVDEAPSDDPRDFLTSALAFIFAIGIIIFVHELDHFTVAKAFGMRVLAFSLGFGPLLRAYRLNLYRGFESLLLRQTVC